MAGARGPGRPERRADAVDALLHQADLSLHQAKQAGRDCIVPAIGADAGAAWR